MLLCKGCSRHTETESDSDSSLTPTPEPEAEAVSVRLTTGYPAGMCQFFLSLTCQ